MSRLKKLKEKRKQEIKSTIIGLALTIFIGATGALGSYAWFVSKHNVKNDLIATMGSLDVEIIEGKISKGLDNVNKEKVICKDFEILSNGSLNQDFKLNIIYEATNIAYLKNIRYQLYPLDKEGNELLDGMQSGSLSKSSKKNILSMTLSPSSSKNFRLKIMAPSPYTSKGDTDINIKLIAEAFNTNKSKSQGGVK